MDSEGQGWKDRALNHEDRIAELEGEVQHQIERREEEKLRAVNAEADLAERDWMLEMAEERVLRVLPTFSPTTAKLIRKVFADLRARAQKP